MSEVQAEGKVKEWEKCRIIDALFGSASPLPFQTKSNPFQLFSLNMPFVFERLPDIYGHLIDALSLNSKTSLHNFIPLAGLGRLFRFESWPVNQPYRPPLSIGHPPSTLLAITVRTISVTCLLLGRIKNALAMSYRTMDSLISIEGLGYVLILSVTSPHETEMATPQSIRGASIHSTYCAQF